MINRAVLVGRLTRDPDLRYTSSGAAVASFTLAVDRPFTNRSGDREADFINCVMWRKAAENFANFTHKGSMVGIDGRIQTRNYENQQGNRVYVTEIVADNFALLESKSQADQYRQQHPQENNSAPSSQRSSQQNNNPYGNPANNQGGYQDQNNSDNSRDPFADNGQQIDISDDDLPF
ncbi:single-stranded DNA-binding protein [Ligilactobacillus salitolerans]|uniref:Single-stranded DNA-binding protein n=1 Tax=Ligilactobacillus salitolerans TaxID=1808352 RepID=A0A401IQ70_9LACO|nr:single-stranded DNA-binding protein [Ligilactobacillus salitolerans]GBG93663.1 single-stranded DNA-binding protein [Ligilactobacillus salitolerans]